MLPWKPATAQSSYERVRLKVPVRVPHDSDLDQVIALMREAASRPDRILTSPAPNVLILSFGESAIELEVRFWIADAQHGVHNVKSEVLYEVWRLFRREGIQIPYPKRDLYVRSTETNEIIDTGCMIGSAGMASAVLARGGTDDASPSSDGVAAI